MSKPKFTGGVDPFGESSNVEAAYAATYGPVGDIPQSGRIVAKPVDIFALRPDLRQPRRAIPASVRGDWDGEPDHLIAVLQQWVKVTERAMNLVELPMARAVVGDWERIITPEDPVALGLLNLIDLAASIARDGLVNPIHVARGIIESGERRWLAYHLLNLYTEDNYAKIPAVEKPEIDVWAQAAENGARTPLNAIGMARQLSLLIMDMYAGDADALFDPFDRLVLPGECDRVYYAQVRDGNTYPIKRGMGERVLNVTGLKSMERVRNFRALLSIPDQLWIKADVQNWTESQIREYVESTKDNNPPVTALHSVGKPTPQRAPVSTPSPAPQEKRQVVEGKSSQPQRYDEGYDDFDTDEEPEEIVIGGMWTGGVASGRTVQTQPTESTLAFVATWGDGRKIGEILAFLKSMAGSNATLRAKITELMRLSPADMQQLQEGTAAGWLETYIDDAAARLGDVLEEEVVQELKAYLEHVRNVGREIRERYK